MDIAATYSRKKVLITGGCGFIGSNLAHELLRLGADVTIVDNLDPDSGGNLFNVEDIKEHLRFIQSDVNDEQKMTTAVKGMDYLFNLAGQTSHLGSMRDPFKDISVNAVGQLRLLEVCRVNNPDVSIIFAGTRQVYGRPLYLPVDEKHLLTPLDNNGVSKRAGEMYHIVYNRVHEMQTCVLRMTNVYGPRMRIKDDLLTFIGWWAHQLLTGEKIQIFGTGGQVRDLNYVDDVVSALLLCAAHPSARGKIYNLGGPSVKLLELAREMIRVNKCGDYVIVPFPENRKRIDIGDYYGDYSLIQKEVGWHPQTPLADGLARMFEYFQSNKDHYL